jgi:hypothetical protein
LELLTVKRRKQSTIIIPAKPETPSPFLTEKYYHLDGHRQGLAARKSGCRPESLYSLAEMAFNQQRNQINKRAFCTGYVAGLKGEAASPDAWPGV